MNWKKLSEKRIWDGYRKIDKRVFKLPSGLELDFEIKNESDVACVLPITREGKVVLVKQFRPGPEEVLTELPAGIIEPGEIPIDAAKRELLEETGYSGNAQFITMTFVEAYSTQKRFHFLITDCAPIQEPEKNEREPLEIVEMEMAEFRDHLQFGQLTDRETGYLGLDLLER